MFPYALIQILRNRRIIVRNVDLLEENKLPFKNYRSKIGENVQTSSVIIVLTNVIFCFKMYFMLFIMSSCRSDINFP